MTTRDRFNKVLHWQKPDRVPNMDFGYWDDTITIWHDQGLPGHVETPEDIERFVGLEGTETIPHLPVINGLCPPFESRVLEDRGEHQIIQRPDGAICESFRTSRSIPRFIKFAIESREDWEVLKRERLDFTSEDRIGDVVKAADEAHASGMPVRFDAGSLYGWLRNWMGLENVSIALKTERRWVDEIMEHLTELTLYLVEKAVARVDVDVAWWWEDMCYNYGPLMSPVMFEEMMVPRYKRITDALKSHGVDVNILDCDGQVYRLVPGWIRGGINCMFPIESAHTDPIRLREEYGENVLLVGGVNKVSLIKGKEHIDRELQRLYPLVKRGGYIPTVDHRVPPDVSFDNYLYYVEKKKAIL